MRLGCRGAGVGVGSWEDGGGDGDGIEVGAMSMTGVVDSAVGGWSLTDRRCYRTDMLRL